MLGSALITFIRLYALIPNLLIGVASKAFKKLCGALFIPLQSMTMMKGQYKQYLWIDSTTLPVCKNQRIQRHKSLVRIASRSKSSMGWFYGCELHIAMNQFGEIACSALSNGHIADIKMVEHLVEGLEAKLYADRSYISQDLKSRLKYQGTDLITYHQKNMQTVQLCA